MKLFLSSGFHGAVFVLVALSSWGVAVEKPAELSKLTDQIVQEKRNAILRANVAGATGAYTWYRNGAIIAGANGPSLAIVSAEASDAGTYSYSVGNEGGTLTSEPITLTVEPFHPGAIDTQFDSETFGTVLSAGRPALRPDGSWIVAERMADYSLALHFYTKDLALLRTVVLEDPGSNLFLESCASDSQGRIWLKYVSNILYHSLESRLVRLTSEGAVDTSFSLSAALTAMRYWLCPDGSVIVAGADIAGDVRALRFLEDGAWDTSFDSKSFGIPLTMQASGWFICSKTNTDNANALPLSRRLPSGEIDAGFVAPQVLAQVAGGGSLVLSAVSSVQVSPHGDLVAVAHRESQAQTVICLAEDGSLKWQHQLDEGVTKSSLSSLGIDQAGGVYVTARKGEETSVLRLSSDGEETYRRSQARLISAINAGANGCYLQYQDQFDGAGVSKWAHFITEDPGKLWLTGLAGRGQPGQLDNTLHIGFVTSGERSPIVLRGLGPHLAEVGIEGADPDPAVSFFRGGTKIDYNDDWASSEMAEKRTQFNAIGLAPLASESKDACLIVDEPAGAYTAIVDSKLASPGIVVGEIYDGVPSGTHLRALALRGHSGRGDDVLIAGFVLNGDGGRWVLVKATGPGLGASGVADALGDPTLSIYDSAGNLVAENDNGAEGDNGLLVAGAARKLGMGQLPSGSLDAATLVWLTPGAYTAVVSDKNGGEGNALIEIYPLF